MSDSIKEIRKIKDFGNKKKKGKRRMRRTEEAIDAVVEADRVLGRQKVSRDDYLLAVYKSKIEQIETVKKRTKINRGRGSNREGGKVREETK